MMSKLSVASALLTEARCGDDLESIPVYAPVNLPGAS